MNIREITFTVLLLGAFLLGSASVVFPPDLDGRIQGFDEALATFVKAQGNKSCEVVFDRVRVPGPYFLRELLSRDDDILAYHIGLKGRFSALLCGLANERACTARFDRQMVEQTAALPEALGGVCRTGEAIPLSGTPYDLAEHRHYAAGP